MPQNSIYKRVMLKLSGEMFGREDGWGINFDAYDTVAEQIIKLVKSTKIELAIVVGGGNIFRGRLVEGKNIDRVVADNIGTLGTIINAIALQEAIEHLGGDTRVMTAIPIPSVAEPYIRRRATRHLEKGRVVIFGGGTGNPFFTTDSAAALRAAEIDCDVLLKATDVDGVYDKDPKKFSDAKKYEDLTYQEALEKGLNVMDSNAFALAKNNDIPIIVFNIDEPEAIKRIVQGERVGTLVHK